MVNMDHGRIHDQHRDYGRLGRGAFELFEPYVFQPHSNAIQIDQRHHCQYVPHRIGIIAPSNFAYAQVKVF